MAGPCPGGPARLAAALEVGVLRLAFRAGHLRFGEPTASAELRLTASKWLSAFPGAPSCPCGLAEGPLPLSLWTPRRS